MRVPIESPRLMTPRLVLRGATLADVPQLLPLSVYDGVPAADEEQAARFLQQIARDQAAGETVHWAIVLCDDERLIVGTCGLYRGLSAGQGEIGYLAKEQHRGRGFMTEAIRAIVSWGFAALGLERIVAYTDRDNVPSRALLTRIGFTHRDGDGSELEYRLTREGWTRASGAPSP